MKPLSSKYRQSVQLLSLGALFLLSAACHCQPCIKPILPIEPHPIMQQVETDSSGGLNEVNTKAMLINLELYRGALDRCNESIRIYNHVGKDTK